MKKIFIDTNVWLRFLTADNKEQFKSCRKLLGKIEEGKLRSYTSVIVLLEIIYTLTSFYKVKKNQVIDDIKNILSTRNLTLVEKTDFNRSLELFSKLSIKLADCLIAAQIPPEVILCTYDQEFKKIKNISVFTPEEILAKLN